MKFSTIFLSLVAICSVVGLAIDAFFAGSLNYKHIRIPQANLKRLVDTNPNDFTLYLNPQYEKNSIFLIDVIQLHASAYTGDFATKIDLEAIADPFVETIDKEDKLDREMVFSGFQLPKAYLEFLLSIPEAVNFDLQPAELLEGRSKYPHYQIVALDASGQPINVDPARLLLNPCPPAHPPR